MQFKIMPTGELIVQFDTHEQAQQLEFLESIITTDEASEVVVQALIETIKGNMHPYLKLVQ